MADRAAMQAGAGPGDGAGMRTSYLRVLICWGLVLAALYAFQEYFA